ncbi:MAG: Ig-like domain-containing protein [Clostridia bacterium]|nr:Ig-like domain-containing protein [Clostridia bacterium]
MKIIAILFIITFFFCLPADAAIGSKGLILEGGKKELVLEKGSKEYLNVQDGFLKLPLFKGVTYYSDNTIVATIGLHSGIIRANSIGTATISAISHEGHAGQIIVKVIFPRKEKIKRFLPIIIIIAPILFVVIKKAASA